MVVGAGEMVLPRLFRWLGGATVRFPVPSQSSFQDDDKDFIWAAHPQPELAASFESVTFNHALRIGGAQLRLVAVPPAEDRYRPSRLAPARQVVAVVPMTGSTATP